ncbi:hypothetical protein COE18_26420 [Bacillus cereus]|nr:hypothetical protein COE18_26420 [Bacillus cereus]
MIRAVFFDLDGTLVDRRQSLENYISDFHNISTYRQKLTNKKEAVFQKRLPFLYYSYTVN